MLGGRGFEPQLSGKKGEFQGSEARRSASEADSEPRRLKFSVQGLLVAPSSAGALRDLRAKR